MPAFLGLHKGLHFSEQRMVWVGRDLKDHSGAATVAPHVASTKH